MSDVLGRDLRVLIALAEHEPMSMTEFMEAAGEVHITALKRRDVLVELGLIAADKKRAAKVTYYEITLTPDGREVAELAAKILRVQDRAKGRHPGRKGKS